MRRAGEKKAGGIPLFLTKLTLQLLFNNGYLDVHHHVGVQLQSDIEFTQRADRAFRHSYFAAFHFVPFGNQCIRNVLRANRPIESTFFAGLHHNGHNMLLQLLRSGLCDSQFLACVLL